MSDLRAQHIPPESIPVSSFPSSRDLGTLGVVYVADNLECWEADSMLLMVNALKTRVSTDERGS